MSTTLAAIMSDATAISTGFVSLMGTFLTFVQDNALALIWFIVPLLAYAVHLLYKFINR